MEWNGRSLKLSSSPPLGARWVSVSPGTSDAGCDIAPICLSALDPLGFDAETGIVEGRRSGFDASFRNPAYAGRLEYSGIRRLTLGLSGYTGVASSELLSVTPRVSIA